MVRTGDWLVPRARGSAAAAEAAAVLLGRRDDGDAARATRAAIAVRLRRRRSRRSGWRAWCIAWGRALGGIGRGLASRRRLLVAMYQFTSSGRRGDAEMLLALLCDGVAVRVRPARTHAAPRAAAGLRRGRGARDPDQGDGGVSWSSRYRSRCTCALRRELRVLRDPARARRPARWRSRSARPGTSRSSLSCQARSRRSGQDLVLPLGAASTQSSRTTRPHFRAPWWYLTVLPTRAAPASVLLPFVIWRLWTTRAVPRRPAHALRGARLRGAVRRVLAAAAEADALHAGDASGARACSVPSRCAPRWLRAARTLARAGGRRAARARRDSRRRARARCTSTGSRRGRRFVIVAVSAFIAGLFAFALVAALRGRTAALAAAWLPAFLLVLALHRAVAGCGSSRSRRADSTVLTLDERERLYRVAREQPWFIDAVPARARPATAIASVVPRRLDADRARESHYTPSRSRHRARRRARFVYFERPDRRARWFTSSSSIERPW